MRAAAKDTLLVADGFSCRTQIEETTDRHALHLAQVLKMGLDHGPRGPAGNFPEQRYIQAEPPVPSRLASLAVLSGLFLLGGVCLGTLTRWGRRK